MTDLGLAGITPEDARSLLDDVDRLQVQARRTLAGGAWQWIAVWAAVCLGAAGSALLPEAVASWYWLGAVPLALVLQVAIDRRLRDRTPLRRRDWPYWLVGGGMAVASFVGSSMLGHDGAVIWVWIVFGLGFGSFFLLERQRWAAALMAALVAGTAVAGITSDNRLALYPVLALVFAATLAGVAAGVRSMAEADG